MWGLLALKVLAAAFYIWGHGSHAPAQHPITSHSDAKFYRIKIPNMHIRTNWAHTFALFAKFLRLPVSCAVFDANLMRSANMVRAAVISGFHAATNKQRTRPHKPYAHPQYLAR